MYPSSAGMNAAAAAAVAAARHPVSRRAFFLCFPSRFYHVRNNGVFTGLLPEKLNVRLD